jgi:hypothetical protein
MVSSTGGQSSNSEITAWVKKVGTEVKTSAYTTSSSTSTSTTTSTTTSTSSGLYRLDASDVS